MRPRLKACELGVLNRMEIQGLALELARGPASLAFWKGLSGGLDPQTLKEGPGNPAVGGPSKAPASPEVLKLVPHLAVVRGVGVQGGSPSI